MKTRVVKGKGDLLDGKSLLMRGKGKTAGSGQRGEQGEGSRTPGGNGKKGQKGHEEKEEETFVMVKVTVTGYLFYGIYL